MKRSLLLSLLAAFPLGVVACGPGLPPKSGPEEVIFYSQETEMPEERYRMIAEIVIEEPLMGTTFEQLVMKIRAEAARMGADGVILREARVQDPSGGRFPVETWVATAIAIYFPDWPRGEETGPPSDGH